jgi:hypothetical protein
MGARDQRGGGGGGGVIEQEIEEGTDMQLDRRTQRSLWLEVYRI